MITLSCLPEIKNKIKEQLMNLKDIDGENLFYMLELKGYFDSPASSKYHGSFNGGLAYHSYKVFELFKKANITYKLRLSDNDVIICSLLHDLCKLGLYSTNNNQISFNRNHPKGHGKLSVQMIKELIHISLIQEEIILYHMGSYGVFGYNTYINEYSLDSLHNVWKINPASKIFYFCDEIATKREEIEGIK